MGDTQRYSYPEKDQTRVVSGTVGLSNVCNVCDTTFATPIDLHFHTRTHCDTSMKADSSSSNYEAKCGTSAGDMFTQETNVNECSVCKVKFSNSQDYYYHMVLHSEDLPVVHVPKSTAEGENKQPVVGQSLSPHRCEICGKSFALKGNLSKHLIRHNGAKPFSCELCGKSFNLKGNRDKHMVTHSHEQPYQCTICSKKFGLKGNLQKHVMIHSDSKCFKCCYCEKEFALKGNLLKHLERHKNGFNRQQPEETYNSKSNLSDNAYDNRTGYIDLLIKVSEKIGVDITEKDGTSTNDGNSKEEGEL